MTVYGRSCEVSFIQLCFVFDLDMTVYGRSCEVSFIQLCFVFDLVHCYVDSYIWSCRNNTSLLWVNFIHI